MFVADLGADRGAIRRDQHALVLAGPVPVERKDRGALRAAVFIERLADDRAAAVHAGVAHGRDDHSVNAGEEHGISQGRARYP